MSYYVYENWRAGPRKAIIHKGNCRSCNEGDGVRGGTRADNGEWHGPFETLNDAMDFANSLNAKEVRTCMRCR